MARSWGTPWWVERAEPPEERAPLAGPRRVQALVVGGGFAGLAAAWTLAEAGQEVLLLEADRVGRASARSAGILTVSVEHDLRDHVRQHGEERAAALWELGVAGVERVAEHCARLPGDPGAFARAGSLYLARPGEEPILAEEAALRARGGHPASLEELATSPLATLGCRAALRAPRDATCDPWGLCQGLARALAARGVTIHERSPALAADPERRAVRTAAGEVLAERVVLAGQEVPRALGQRGLSLELATFCLVTAPLAPATLRALGLEGRESFWDSALPFFYGRLTPDDRLLVGGSDLLGALARGPLVPRALARLERELRRRLPAVEEPVVARWGGTLRLAPDGLPRLGGGPGWARAGLSAGIGQALLAGELAAELALGRDPPRAALLREDRPAGWGERLRAPLESLRLLTSLLRG